jgi:hypothetical protein
VTGEKLSQAGWLSSSSSGSQGSIGEAKFTSSSGGVRAPSVNANKGLRNEERLETVPSSVKYPEEVSNSGESQLPEGKRLLLCISTGGRLWRFRIKCGFSQMKKRRKAEQTEWTLREGHAVRARPVKTFR